MERINKYITTITASFLMLLLALNLSAQSRDEVLKRLDSIAFDAYEKNSKDAINKANELLNKSKKSKPSLYTVNAYTLLGILNKDKGHYISSLNNYLKALNVSEKINDTARISACYNNIGSIYKLQENYPKALQYFHKSLDIEKSLNQPLQKSIRYYNIGEIYSVVDSLDLALTYFNNSLLIEERANNTEGIIYALLGISDVYIKINHYVDARISLDRVTRLIGSSNIEESIILNKLNGELAFKQKKFSDALNFFQSAQDISKKNNFKSHLLSI